MAPITRIRLSIIVLLALCLCAGNTDIAIAQAGATSASIIGVVTDEQGARLAGAVVKARNLSTNLVREVTADEEGAYRILQLPSGRYEVTTTVEGFQTTTLNLDLELGTTALADLKLLLGTTSDIVEIKATSASAELTRTESSTNVDNQRIDNLPINRRNFLDFSLTAARVVMDRLPAQGAAASSGLSFNGQTARFNNITIDGLDNNDTGPGTVRSTYSQDAVQEYQIISDSYSAEFGRAVGGVVNIVTKGGGNDLHGNLFLFNRNDKISARDVFAPFRAPYQQYQFGAVLSGPIKKDRAFFFTSFERLSIKQNQFVTISDRTVASARRRGFTLNNGPVPFALNTTSLLGRVDLRLSDRDTLWIRYNYGGTFNGAYEPFGALVGESNAGVQKLTDNTLAISNTYLSGIGFINETRFLYGRRNQRVLPLEGGPQVRIVDAEGLITFGRGSILPQMRNQPSVQIVNNSTIARGVNTIKFGVDYLRISTPDLKTDLPVFAGGFSFFTPFDFASIFGVPGLPSFTGLESFDPSLRTPAQRAFLAGLATQLPAAFPGFPRGLPLADLSLPTVFIQGFGDTRTEIVANQFSAFFQNDIAVRPNLMIKLGMRYDINRIRFIPDNNGNISPRVSFSYQPARIPNLTVRGAYGIFFGVPLFGGTIASEPTVTGRYKIATIPFPFSILPFALPGRRFPESQQIPAGVQFIPQLSQSFPFQPDIRNSYAQQATLGVGYQLGENTVITLSYQFVRGLKLFSLRNINPIVRPVPGNPVLGAITGRIDPTQGDLIELESAFDSYYQGATISINRRLSKKFGFLAHYTFSKALDNFVDVRPDVLETADPMNLAGERGYSLQDVRSRFVFSGIWDLDYTSNALLRGFQVSTIINLNSGRPFNLLAGVDLNQNGDNPPGDRPAGLARNIGVTPGFVNFDLRLTRSIAVTEQCRVQGFVEVFNLFNRTNISEVARSFPPDAQGNFQLPPRESGRFIATPDRYRNAFAPRQFQFGFRVSF